MSEITNAFRYAKKNGAIRAAGREKKPLGAVSAPISSIPLMIYTQDDYNEQGQVISCQPFVSLALDDDVMACLPEWALPWISEHKGQMKKFHAETTDGKMGFVNFDVSEIAVSQLLAQFGINKNAEYLNQCITQEKSICFEVRHDSKPSHFVLHIPKGTKYLGFTQAINEAVKPQDIILGYDNNDYTTICLKPKGFKRLESLIDIHRDGYFDEPEICILQKPSIDIPPPAISKPVRARA